MTTRKSSKRRSPPLDTPADTMLYGLRVDVEIARRGYRFIKAKVKEVKRNAQK